MPQGAWASMTLLTEEGDDFWCEDLHIALEELTRLRGMGYHVTTMLINENTAFSEELDCQRIGQDITIDLNGCVLTNEPWAVGWMSCIVYYIGCDYRITIQNGTIESNELDAICFQGVDFNHHQKLILKNVNVVTHQEGRHCLFDAMSWDWEDWGYDGDPESSPKLQIIDSQFHSNGCSAISFTLLRNDEYVKSILPEGYSFYNANTDVELAEYADRPFVDENGNPATDIRTGVSQDLPKIKISDSDGYGYYCGNFKQAMDIYGFYGMTLTLLDDVKEGLCTTNSNCMSVTIDLNGHTLDITRLYANGDYLNIIDSSEGKTGKLIVERFDVYEQTENNAVIEGNVKTWGDDMFTNNGLVEYVDGSFINNGDFITSWTWADDHSSATLRINHEDVDAVLTNEDTTPATCIASGVRTYTAAATYRDRNYADTKDEEIAIDPNAHDYQVQLDENEKPVFVWSEDYTSATLQVVCSHNAEHTANVEVTLGEGITWEETTPATCVPGVCTFTATATYEGETYTGTAIVATDPIAEHTLDEHNVCTGCGHGFIFFEKEVSYDIEPENRYAFSNSEGPVEYLGNTTFNEWMYAFEFSGLVTEIGNNAFYFREALTAIYLPEVTTIGEEAFIGCDLRVNVSLPKATTIGQAAFLGCGFQTISLPEATTIGYMAFGSCGNLSSIELPKATTIGDYAFDECSNLNSITVACAADLSRAEIPEGATITRVHDFSSKALTASPVEDGLYAYACDNGCGQGDEHRFIKDFNGEDNHLELAKDGEGNYSTSENIEIVDATAYVSPVEFTAPSIEYTRTFGGTNWTTWYVPFDLVLTDEICAKLAFSRINNVHQYDDNEDGNADRTVIESFRQKTGVTLKANYPYLVKALDESALSFELNLSDVELAPAKENSIDCQSVDYLYTFTGTYTGKGDSGSDNYSLFDDVADNSWYHFHSLAPQRHYMTITSRNGGYGAGPAHVKLVVVGEENVTGIVTLYDNGQQMQSETYDLSGRRIESDSQPGLRIVNGKVRFTK